MKIALLANDIKKELMVQFCIAYCGTLAKHTIFATGTTGRTISDATGLKINNMLPGADGGVHQILSMVSYNEIDLVIAFRDPTARYDSDQDFLSLIKECDMNSVPIATNVGTAEVLIQGLERGDLDWREIVNPSK